MDKEKIAAFLGKIEKDLEQSPRNQLLADAISINNPILAEFALLAGANIDLKIPDYTTVISWAISYGYENIVRLCLERGATVSDADFIYLCKNDSDTLVKLIIDFGAIDDINANNGTFIVEALDVHAVEVVNILIKAGADLTFDNYLPLRMAAQENLDDLFAFMMKSLAK